jgi:flagellar hook-associated protein 2
MTSINFTGLASGLDTDMIVKSLIEMERQPLTRLEDDKKLQETRLEAFKTYHDKLSALNTAVGALYLSSSMRESQVSLSTEDYISANVTSAQPGTYKVAVEQLAQVQKSVSKTAFTSRTDNLFGTGDLNLVVAGKSHSISITHENNSLNGIMAAVNQSTNIHGISASIVDNGNEDGDRYYLVLSGTDSSMEFTMESNLVGGTANLDMQKTQEAQKAVAQIDGIRITSKTNTIKDAANGISLTLESVSPDNGSGELTPTIMTVTLNKDSVLEKIENFVTAYNDIIAFVSGKPTEEEPGIGMLANDSMVNVTRRKLQNMLVTQVKGTDTYTALAHLGLSTNKDGTISLDGSKLTKAVEENFDDVARLMAGDDGIFKQYRSFLNNSLSSSSGLYATRQQSAKRITDRIDKDIVQMEARLEKREQMLIKRFTAMESLVSGLNAQSDYLTQQMDILSNMGGKKRK